MRSNGVLHMNVFCTACNREADVWRTSGAMMRRRTAWIVTTR